MRKLHYFLPVTLCALLLCSALPLIASQPEATIDTARSRMPERWRYQSDYSQQIPSDDRWWQTFDDPTLDSLISVGVDRNIDIAVAARRIDLARQTVRQARAGYFPTLTASAGWNKVRQSGNTTKYSVPATTLDYFNLGVDMSWEIDLFGRITAQTRQAKKKLQATRADYVATLNSLCAQIATTYIDLRTDQTRLAVAQSHLASQEKVLKIAQARHEAGLNSKLDVAQASTIYNTTVASIPPLQAQIEAYLSALAVLIGEYPGSLALDTRAAIPAYRQIIGVGVPMDLIRRRPDVVEAEYSLAAAASAVGIAKKDFLPTLALTGSFGVESHKLGKLFKGRSITYSIAPRLSWTIFDGLARNARVASARDEMEIAIGQYNLTLMTATQEVQSAMAQYRADLQAIDALEKVVASAKEELDLSLDQYKQGLEGFYNVASAQITFLQEADQLAAARGQAAAAAVTLYKALGGGWTVAGIPMPEK